MCLVELTIYVNSREAFARGIRCFATFVEDIRGYATFVALQHSPEAFVALQHTCYKMLTLSEKYNLKIIVGKKDILYLA